MSFRLEIRFAIAMNLLMLLWMSLEFALGVQDKYISYEPLVTMVALIFIPVVCSWLAIKEKKKLQAGSITFREVFMTGFLIGLFAAIVAVPSQLLFHTVINPDFFQNMIAYSQARAASLKMNVEQARAGAELYFNLSSYLIQGFFGTLFFGTILSVVMAWRMQTVNEGT